MDPTPYATSGLVVEDPGFLLMGDALHQQAYVPMVAVSTRSSEPPLRPVRREVVDADERDSPESGPRSWSLSPAGLSPV